MNKHERWRDRAIKLIRRKIPFDAYVWGTGQPDDTGAMEIDVEKSRSSLGQSALRHYNTYLRHKDVLGRLHVAFPDPVRVWDLKAKSHSAKEVQDFLEGLRPSFDGQEVQQLLLSGLCHRDGTRAWMVLYRLNPKDPFTNGQTDYARFAIPYMLNRWLDLLVEQSVGGKPGRRPDDTERAQAIESGLLTPADFVVSSGYALHLRPAQVARLVDKLEKPRELKNAVAADKRHEARVRKKLLVDRNGLLRLFLGLK
jgi:hypothetical protein